MKAKESAAQAGAKIWISPHLAAFQELTYAFAEEVPV
jgi:hypothetical protein